MSRVLWLVCCCGVLALAARRKFFNSYAGPYWIVFESEPCPVEGDLTHVILKRDVLSVAYNRTAGVHIVKSSVNLTRDLERGLLTVHYDIAKWDTVSGWREHFFIWNFGELCQFLETAVRAQWENVRTHYSPPLPAECPIPKGERTATWITKKTYLAVFPVLPYGRYRSYLFFRHAKTRDILMAGCTVAKIVPRET